MTSSPRSICFHYPYVILQSALRLCPSTRRETEICYFTFVRALDDDTYVARVGTSLEQLCNDGFTYLLTREQWQQALPYDVRLRTKSPEQIVAILRAHAASVRSSHSSVPTNDAERDTYEAPSPSWPHTPAPAKQAAMCECSQHRKPIAITVDLSIGEIQRAYEHERRRAAHQHHVAPQPSSRTLLQAAFVHLVAVHSAERGDPRRRQILRHQQLHVYRLLTRSRLAAGTLEIMPIYETGRQIRYRGCRLCIRFATRAEPTQSAVAA